MGLYNEIRILQHRAILDEIAGSRGARAVPYHVRLETTESCNFQCKFCWWHADDRRAGLPHFDFTGRRRLPLERLLRLIDELAELGTRAISFTGAGDPLVYPKMEQVLQRIRAQGIHFAVTSNLAMKISDALIQELAHASWIRWSMNAGTADVYAQTNNPAGSHAEMVFERALENVRRLRAARQQLPHPPAFNASYVVAESNQNDTYAAAQRCAELGLDSISFRPDTPFERQMQPLSYSDEVKRDILRAKEEFERPDFKVHMNVDRLEDIRKIGDPEIVCYYSNHTTYIAANGDVYPCCYTRYHYGYVMGNILEQPFRAFWESEARRRNYKKLSFDACPACPYGKTNQILKDLYAGNEPAGHLLQATENPDPFI